MSRNRKDKPCARCLGVVLTWSTADDYEFCPHHLGEIMRDLTSDANGASMRLRLVVPGTDSIQ